MNFEAYSAYRLNQLHKGIKRIEVIKTDDFEVSRSIATILRLSNDNGILNYIKQTYLDEGFSRANVTFSKRKDDLQFLREIEIVYNKATKYIVAIRIGCVIYDAWGFNNLRNEGFFNSVENLTHLFVLAQNSFRALHDMNTQQGLKVIFEQHEYVKKMIEHLRLNLEYKKNLQS